MNTVLKLRKVARSQGKLVLEKTERQQAWHLVSTDSRVQVGDIVLARLIQENEKSSVYNCRKVSTNRMVLEFFPKSLGHEASVICDYRGTKTEIKNFARKDLRDGVIELETTNTNGYRFALVWVNSEDEVYKILLKGYLRNFICYELNFCSTFINGPQFERSDKDISLEIFKRLWSDVGWYHERFSDEEWLIMVSHLAICSWQGNHKPIDHVNAIANYCTDHFSNFSDITRIKVFQYLSDIQNFFTTK